MSTISRFHQVSYQHRGTIGFTLGVLLALFLSVPITIKALEDYFTGDQGSLFCRQLLEQRS